MLRFILSYNSLEFEVDGARGQVLDDRVGVVGAREVEAVEVNEFAVSSVMNFAFNLTTILYYCFYKT